MKNRRLIISLILLGVSLVAQHAIITASANRKAATTKFTVRVENISSVDGQTAKDGTKWPFALSPGMFVLSDKNPLFTEGRAAKNGLENQAEDGNPAGLISSLEMMHHAAGLHGVFNTPAGAMGPGPIGPGAVYEFTVNATPKMRLYMTMMFGQSNDLFYGPDANGISLFDAKGNAISGDVTGKLVLWDAGTEVNEEEGVGPNQAPRQKAANTGPAENGVVHRAKDVRFYGKNAELFRVTVTPENGM